jgi:hypothetical protein
MLKHGGTGLIGLIIAGLAVAACLRSGLEVVVYPSEDQVFSEPVLKDFEKASGIKVRAVSDTEATKSTGVALRIVAERDRPQAAVFSESGPEPPLQGAPVVDERPALREIAGQTGRVGHLSGMDHLTLKIDEVNGAVLREARSEGGVPRASALGIARP